MDLPSTVTLDTKSCYLHNLSEAEQISQEDTGLFWKLQKLQFSFQFFTPKSVPLHSWSLRGMSIGAI